MLQTVELADIPTGSYPPPLETSRANSFAKHGQCILQMLNVWQQPLARCCLFALPAFGSNQHTSKFQRDQWDLMQRDLYITPILRQGARVHLDSTMFWNSSKENDLYLKQLSIFAFFRAAKRSDMLGMDLDLILYYSNIAWWSKTSSESCWEIFHVDNSIFAALKKLHWYANACFDQSSTMVKTSEQLWGRVGV